jgi:hypothetical protein
MKILLDECVPQRLRNHFPGHECQSAQYAGFAGLENGDLLRAAEAAKFDVLLTVDRGFEYEQTRVLSIGPANPASKSPITGRLPSWVRHHARRARSVVQVHPGPPKIPSIYAVILTFIFHWSFPESILSTICQLPDRLNRGPLGPLVTIACVCIHLRPATQTAEQSGLEACDPLAGNRDRSLSDRFQ